MSNKHGPTVSRCILLCAFYILLEYDSANQKEGIESWVEGWTKILQDLY